MIHQKKVFKQHRKRECLKVAINKRKAYFLIDKKQCTHDRLDRAMDKHINKVYGEHKQLELNRNTEKLEKRR